MSQAASTAAAAPAPILVEAGANPEVLVIACTGFKGRLMMPTLDFLALTGLSGYSRILLLDTSQTCYMGGLPPLFADYAALLAHLRESIARLAPRKIICIGASSGGFAALLFGHELGADYVHAFSPYTYLDAANGLRYRDPDVEGRAEAYHRIQGLPQEVHRLFDLQQVLAQDNGSSRYFIHACRNSQWDMLRAKHVESCPGVVVVGYPCQSHGVAATLARAGLLDGLLKLENQDQMVRRILAAVARLRQRDAN